jgi:hypothetical protein
MAPIGADIDQSLLNTDPELLVRPAKKATSDCAKKLRRYLSLYRWEFSLGDLVSEVLTFPF